jgi:hypothetical protein
MTGTASVLWLRRCGSSIHEFPLAQIARYAKSSILCGEKRGELIYRDIERKFSLSPLVLPDYLPRFQHEGASSCPDHDSC